jgi:hypothetical protein
MRIRAKCSRRWDLHVANAMATDFAIDFPEAAQEEDVLQNRSNVFFDQDLRRRRPRSEGTVVPAQHRKQAFGIVEAILARKDAD